MASGIDSVTMLKMVRHYVQNHFENVGTEFAKQAREMYRGEISVKNIYGKVTPEEKEQLTEEEIPCAVLPELPPEYNN